MARGGKPPGSGRPSPQAAGRSRGPREDLDATLRGLVARGAYEGAARILAEHDRFEEAAELFGRAGLHYDGALIHLRSGDRRQALDAFMRVPASDPRYRAACGRAVGLAADLGVLTIVLDHFLARFIKTGPLEAEEHETFYQIGQHYRRHGFLQAAREAVEKLLEVSPAHRDAHGLLGQIEAAARAERMGAQNILAEEVAFRAQGSHPRPRTRPTADPSFSDEPVDD